jgi:hypothetical protein
MTKKPDLLSLAFPMNGYCLGFLRFLLLAFGLDSSFVFVSSFFTNPIRRSRSLLRSSSRF